MSLRFSRFFNSTDASMEEWPTSSETTIIFYKMMYKTVKHLPLLNLNNAADLFLRVYQLSSFQQETGKFLPRSEKKKERL